MGMETPTLDIIKAFTADGYALVRITTTPLDAFAESTGDCDQTTMTFECGWRVVIASQIVETDIDGSTRIAGRYFEVYTERADGRPRRYHYRGNDRGDARKAARALGAKPRHLDVLEVK